MELEVELRFTDFDDAWLNCLFEIWTWTTLNELKNFSFTPFYNISYRWCIMISRPKRPLSFGNGMSKMVFIAYHTGDSLSFAVRSAPFEKQICSRTKIDRVFHIS